MEILDSLLFASGGFLARWRRRRLTSRLLSYVIAMIVVEVCPSAHGSPLSDLAQLPARVPAIASQGSSSNLARLPAWVAAMAPPWAPFDLVWTATDPNGLPLNAKWAWQRAHPGSLPDAVAQCLSLPLAFSDKRCTTQSTTIDTARGWNGSLCDFDANTKIPGHVNWMAATWQGTLFWDGHSNPVADDDYNVNLVPPEGDGLTVSSSGSIHSEFDSDETIDHFRSPWWNSFHDAVDQGDANARAIIDGKFAIVIGLAGLDCEHSCSMELHPVYGLAIHVNDDPLDDTWAIFVRNWGNEGYCSQHQHLLFTNQIAFLIPQPSATAVQVNVASTFLNNNTVVTISPPSLVPGKGAVVQFELPDPQKQESINGELHLTWTLAPGANRVPVAGGAALPIPSGPHVPDIEERLGELEKHLSTEARRAMLAKLARPAILPKAPGAPSVGSVIDSVKAARDLQRARAMCDAFEGNIPGAPNACIGVRR